MLSTIKRRGSPPFRIRNFDCLTGLGSCSSLRSAPLCLHFGEQIHGSPVWTNIPIQPEEIPMAKTTAHPDHRLISSEDVQNTDVYGLGDQAIGEIDHLLIDKVSGRVAYAVMSFGGF